MRESRFLIISFAAIFLTCLLIRTAFGATWEKILGGDETDIGYSVQQTTDGGYIIAGETYSFGVAVSDVYLIKTDATGEEVWSKTFGSTRYDRGKCVRQTTDGGYIVAGSMEPSGPGTDVYLIKTDANGDEIWSKTFGGGDYDYGESVQQTDDGGYVIVGYTQSFGAGNADVYLIKTDANGDEIWSKTFGGSGYDVGYSIIQTDNSGYIIVGRGYGGVYLIYFKPTPVLADFSALPISGSAPLNVHFTDQSTGDIASWQWDFGDGSIITEQNPTHTYTDAGIYTVSLTLTGPGGTHTVVKDDLITVQEDFPWELFLPAIIRKN